MSLKTSVLLWNTSTKLKPNNPVLSSWRKRNLNNSEQSEAHRQKNKAARERRAARVAEKKEALLGDAPKEVVKVVEAPKAAPKVEKEAAKPVASGKAKKTAKK
jgi:hypothetical protein